MADNFDMSSGSISVSITKGSVYESGGLSMYDAALEDALGREEKSISNESIQKGDALLDTYAVEANAISGGMGSVWRVHHQSWNIDLAMKRPQPRFFAEGSRRRKENFIKECEAWINLGLHPNIVSCYYVREIGGVPTIFSEWMDNGSLKDRIRDGSLYEGAEAGQEERLLDLAIQFARGLRYSHDNGLIHRDVKPDNLLLTKEWDAKVSDFGLAKARDEAISEDGTAHKGGYTPEYCSSEQAAGRLADARTDVYSWALTVLEMYTKGRVWESGPEVSEHREQYIDAARLPLPEGLRGLLYRCLEAGADKRPGDFAQIEAALNRIYKDETGNDYPREASKAAADTADSLNNRALSMLDLSKPEEAEKLWERAIHDSPQSRLANYNYLIWQWRAGKMDDTECGRRFSLVAENQNDPLLMNIKRAACQEARAVQVANAVLNRPVLCGGNRIASCVIGKGGAVREISLMRADSLEPIGMMIADHENEEFTHVFPYEQGLCTITKDGIAGHTPVIYLDIWDISTQKRMRRTELLNAWDILQNAALSKDGKRLLLWRSYYEAPGDDYPSEASAVYDTDNGGLLWRRNTIYEPVSAAISDRGEYAVITHAHGLLELRDGNTGDTLAEVNPYFDKAGHKANINDVQFLPDASAFLSVGSDKKIILWHTKTLTVIKEFMGHTQKVLRVALSAGGSRFLSTAPGELKLWSLSDGRSLHSERANQSGYEICADELLHSIWFPDGRYTLLTAFDEAAYELSCIQDFSGAAKSERERDQAVSQVRQLIQDRQIAEALALIQKHNQQTAGFLHSEESQSLYEFAGKFCHRSAVTKVEQILEIALTVPSGLGSIAFCDGESSLAAASSSAGYPICKYKLENGAFAGEMPLTTGYGGCIFSPNGDYAAKVHGEGNNTEAVLGAWDGYTAHFSINSSRCTLAFSADSKYLLALDRDQGGSFQTCAAVWEMGKGMVSEGADTVYFHETACYALHGDKQHMLQRTLLDPIAGDYELVTPDRKYCLRCGPVPENELPDVRELPRSERWIAKQNKPRQIVLCGLQSPVTVMVESFSQAVFFAMSADGCKLLTGTKDGRVRLYRICYQFEFPGFSDWDEGARPYLEIFLTIHPDWTDEDFGGFISELQNRGYGWLRPEGVRAKILEMQAVRARAMPEKKKFSLFAKRK